MPFQCSICGEESTRICARCTKDACDNHLCEKCRRCSDCCECEVALSPHAPGSVREAMHPETVTAPAPVEPIAEAPPETLPSPPEPPAEPPIEPAVAEAPPEPEPETTPIPEIPDPFAPLG